MTHRTNQQQNREKRFEMTGGRHVVVTIQSMDRTHEDVVTSARLLDLSESGAKLALGREVPINQQLRIRLDVEELGLDLYIAGDVCWCRPDDEDAWHLGCSVLPVIPSRIIEHLATGNRADRRDERRWHDTVDGCTLSVNAADEKVRMQNFSEGGVCLLTPQSVNVGETFELTMPQQPDAALAGRVQWSLQVADGYLLGCAWDGREDFDRLTAILSGEELGGATADSSPTERDARKTEPIETHCADTPPPAHVPATADIDWKSFFRTKIMQSCS